MIYPPILCRKKGNKIIKGLLTEAFVRVKDQYRFVQLRVYADNTIAGDYLIFNMPLEKLKKYYPDIPEETLKNSTTVFTSGEIDCVISFEDFKELVFRKLVTQNYKGIVYLDFSLADSVPLEVNSQISDKDFLISIDDLFCKLNNELTSYERCRKILREFLKASPKEKEWYREKLKKSYMGVPEKDREFIIMSDQSDDPIKEILLKKSGSEESYEKFIKLHGDEWFKELDK